MAQIIANWQAWWRGEDVLDHFALSASLRSPNLIPLLLSGKGPHPPYHYFLRTKPGGEGRIRTSEGIANRFTVCPLWPLGNLSDSKSPFLIEHFLLVKKKTGKSMSYISGIRIIKNLT
jgi:hypothetical protein